MRSIAVSYATYSTSGGRVRTLTEAKMTADPDVIFSGVAGVAQFLAKQCDLADASIWIIDSDPAVAAYAQILPAIVGYRDADNAFQTSEEWTADVPVGYDFAIGVSGNAPTSTTPLLWTRALTTAGTWGKDSPWGKEATWLFRRSRILLPRTGRRRWSISRSNNWQTNSKHRDVQI